MKKRGFKIIIIFLIIIAISSYYITRKEITSFNNTYQNPLCGPQSLLTICNLYGIDSNLDELCKLTNYDEEYGTTFLNLYIAAKSMDLPVIPLRISLDEYLSINEPGIAFVDNSHFLVILGVKSNDIYIREGIDNYSVSLEDFAKRWEGEVLIFSENIINQSKNLDNIDISKGPYILFEETTKFLGTIDESTTLSYNFKFKNIGIDTLKLVARGTCSCTTVNSNTLIAPGTSSEIKVNFNTTGKKGLDKEIIYVKTNDPQNPLVELALIANIHSFYKVIPHRIYIDTNLKQYSISKELKLTISDESEIVINSIHCPKGITTKVLPVQRDSSIGKYLPIVINIDNPEILNNDDTNLLIDTLGMGMIEVPIIFMPSEEYSIINYSL